MLGQTGAFLNDQDVTLLFANYAPLAVVHLTMKSEQRRQCVIKLLRHLARMW